MNAIELDGAFGRTGMALKALEFARRRHDFDRYDGKPYEVHLLAVEDILIDHGFDGALWRAAALLHDTIEDTGTTRGEIEQLFDGQVTVGSCVSTLVWACTGIGVDRKSRQADIYRKLTVFPLACPLKVADRIANVEAAVGAAGVEFGKMYISEADRFDDVTGAHVPPAMRARLDKAYAAIVRTFVYGSILLNTASRRTLARLEAQDLL